MAVLWTLLHFGHLFFIIYKKGINSASIINRINYLSEKVLRSKNDKVVIEIYLKSLGTKKKLSNICSLVKKMKRAICSNTIN